MISAYVIPGIQRIPIEAIAASIWRIDVNMLTKKTRKREVVEARQVLMKYRKETMKMSLSEAAQPYGKDHATVLHAIKTVNNLKETDSNFRVKYELFLERAKQPNTKR